MSHLFAELDEFDLWNLAHKLHTGEVRATSIEAVSLTACLIYGQDEDVDGITPNQRKAVTDELSALSWEVEAEQLQIVALNPRMERNHILGRTY